jgi:hypothetical protein
LRGVPDEVPDIKKNSVEKIEALLPEAKLRLRDRYCWFYVLQRNAVAVSRASSGRRGGRRRRERRLGQCGRSSCVLPWRTPTKLLWRFSVVEPVVVESHCSRQRSRLSVERGPFLPIKRRFQVSIERRFVLSIEPRFIESVEQRCLFSKRGFLVFEQRFILEHWVFVEFRRSSGPLGTSCNDQRPGNKRDWKLAAQGCFGRIR